jgi:hypothetical protein
MQTAKLRQPRDERAKEASRCGGGSCLGFHARPRGQRGCGIEYDVIEYDVIEYDVIEYNVVEQDVHEYDVVEHDAND